MEYKNKILFVTNVNMASNPRCLKEVKAATQSGYDVTVLKFVFNNWSNEYEREIENELKTVKWIKLSSGKEELLPWILSTLMYYISGIVLKFSKQIKFISYFLDKRSYLINQRLKSIKERFDIVIAHNPGAFFPAYQYTKSASSRLGIDIEDYHPGEFNDKTSASLMSNMMMEVLSSADYITAASPLILNYATENINNDSAPKVVINNVFSLKEQPAFKDLEQVRTFQLFWFSQHIGLDRGIQEAIAAMNLIDNCSLQLTLMGNCTVEVKNHLLSCLTNNKHSIVFKSPVSEKELIEESSNHHIGLALENGANFNRNLCLTNKLFTYLLAGNVIVASDTAAQSTFIEQNLEVGRLYTLGNTKELAIVLEELINNGGELTKMRKAAYSLGSEKYNWEKEQTKFLELLQLKSA